MYKNNIQELNIRTNKLEKNLAKNVKYIYDLILMKIYYFYFRMNKKIKEIYSNYVFIKNKQKLTIFA